MRKLFIFILTAAVLCSSCACGKSGADDRNKVIGGDENTASGPVELLSMPASQRINTLIYQVNPKLYGSSGAFGKIEKRLDAIKGLGIDILYLMPVYEEGKEKAIGSPYCIKDFKKVNSSYGTLAELKSLVDAAHGKGMKVMFDWVANHTAWDNAWVKEHKDWYEKDKDGNIVYPTKDGAWTDVAQLDYSNKELWSAMEDALEYWVTELDIDGYRCDYAHGVRDDFWKDAIARLKALKPGFLILAESDFERMFNDGFDIIFDRAMKARMRDLFGGGKSADFFSWYKSDQGKTPAGKSKLFFITNHDDATEGYPAQQFGSNDGGLAAFVLMSSLNGASMIYGSQETGYAKTINFFNPMSFDWNANSSLASSYASAMGSLAKVDRSGQMTAYGQGTVVFVSWPNALVVVNTGATPAAYGLPASLAGKNGLPKEVSLGAYGFKIYSW